jgi:photosystem II stability/assembly factor-like uncharacterized protein
MFTADALYAGTDNGVYATNAIDANASWSSIGLVGRRVRAMVALEDGEILAAAESEGQGPNAASLHVSRGLNNARARIDRGHVIWRERQAGFGGPDGPREVRSLARLGNGLLLAGGLAGVIAKSSDSGESWKVVWGAWTNGGLGVHAIAPDPREGSRVFAGGESGFFQPFLLRSTDSGQSFAELAVPASGDNAHYSITIGSDNCVFSGMEGRIVRSPNGGDTWEAVVAPDERLYFFGLGLSPNNPAIVYAAGSLNQTGTQDLRLYVSTDRGDSWMTLRAQTVVQAGTLSLAVRVEAGVETVYMGTGSGVFSYRPE